MSLHFAYHQNKSQRSRLHYRQEYQPLPNLSMPFLKPTWDLLKLSQVLENVDAIEIQQFTKSDPTCKSPITATSTVNRITPVESDPFIYFLALVNNRFFNMNTV